MRLNPSRRAFDQASGIEKYMWQTVCDEWGASVAPEYLALRATYEPEGF